MATKLTKQEKTAIIVAYVKDPKYHRDFETRYDAMKHCAELRGKDFDKSREYKQRLEKLLQFPYCVYCKQPKVKDRFMSIDCDVPADGYTIGNSLPCCTRCNMLKRMLTGAEFLGTIIAIKQHDSQLSQKPAADAATNNNGTSTQPIELLSDSDEDEVGFFFPFLN
jgi:hypothetical protein